MRTTIQTARGKPLAILLLLLMVSVASGPAVWGSSIQVQQFLDVGEIFVAGMGESSEIATLTMILGGAGPLGRYPIDCMLVMDVSATSDLATAKQFAFDLITRLGPNDRIGLVTFGTSATLRVALTTNRTGLRTAIGDLAVEGKSALGLGLQTARRELTQNGRSDAVLVEVILSDGQNNVGTEPTVEGTVAAENGITMVSVGIGTLINRTLLEAFASQTEGLFFLRPSSSALEQIVEHVAVSTAATEIVITKVLPAGLRFVGATPSAYRVEMDSRGATTATWRIAELALGQEIAIQMMMEAVEEGGWSTDLGAWITFADFRGVAQSLEVASEAFSAVMPNRTPVALYEFSPKMPTTSDLVQFVDLSTDIDAGGSVVARRWDFGDGASSAERNPAHRYVTSGTYSARLTVIDDRGAESAAYVAEIVVGNAPPVAGFVTRNALTLAEIARPRVGVEFLLDASLSYDFDGSIVSYEWDFNSDGLVDEQASLAEAITSFESPGEKNVTLVVIDDEGARTTLQKTLKILSSVTAIRSIETCLPVDRTIVGGVVTVTITLQANTALNGLTVSETLPAGWAFGEVDNDGATLRVVGQALEWLFLERFVDDQVDARREIRYSLVAPGTALETDLAGVSILGTVGSSSPRISQQVSGEDKIAIALHLPVPVVVSRWDTEAESLDLCMQELITFDQIQFAVSLWLSGASVPYSDNATIDLAMIQDLIAYWLTGRSVHDPLP